MHCHADVVLLLPLLLLLHTTADLVNIFTMFIPQLLSYPNPTDPLNGEAASLMLRDPAAYAARIRDSVKLHASKPVAFDDGEGTGGNGGGSSSGSGSSSRNRGRSVSDLSSKAGCSSASSSGTGSSFGSPSLMSLGSSSAGDVSAQCNTLFVILLLLVLLQLVVSVEADKSSAGHVRAW
jgi:hypothetical protein